MYASDVHQLDLETLRKSIRQAQATGKYHRQWCARLGLGTGAGESDRSVSTAANRLVSFRLEPGRHPISGERRAGLLFQGLRAARGRFDAGLARRMSFALWFILMAFAPLPLARRLAELYWFPERRKGILR
jgi:hypothetical protein